MHARAQVALGAGSIPVGERHLLDLTKHELVDVVGEDRPDWEAAKAACPIPDDAVLLVWFREE